MTFPSDHHRITAFYLKGEIDTAFLHHRITTFFPKVKIGQAVFPAFHHRMSPNSSPLFSGLNHPISKRKFHAITASPLSYTSLLYRTGKNEEKKNSLAHSVRYCQKSGDSVMRGPNRLERLGNPHHRSLVMLGDFGDAQKIGKSRSTIADGRSLS
ncbi:MAG TPA: hypothetical protein PKW95_13330 [bacterium]|nr:hypothetical protein [bacterium]